MRRANCNHSEGPQHDCAYVDRRNRQIIAAARLTDGIECHEPACDEEEDRWDAEYLRTMERLFQVDKRSPVP